MPQVQWGKPLILRIWWLLAAAMVWASFQREPEGGKQHVDTVHDEYMVNMGHGWECGKSFVFPFSFHAYLLQTGHHSFASLQPQAEQD